MNAYFVFFYLFIFSHIHLLIINHILQIDSSEKNKHLQLTRPARYNLAHDLVKYLFPNLHHLVIDAQPKKMAIIQFQYSH